MLELQGAELLIASPEQIIYFVGPIDNKNNKVVYCCANQWPKPKCYDTFQECLAHCHARNLKFPSE